MRIPCVAFAAVLAAGAAGSWAAQPACHVPGEPVQWVADWCMLRARTDDEIAVSGCIARESRRHFASACASNTHFKRRMCALSIRRGTLAGTVARCVRDPAFRGRTVERGGVGG